MCVGVHVSECVRVCVCVCVRGCAGVHVLSACMCVRVHACAPTWTHIPITLAPGLQTPNLLARTFSPWETCGASDKYFYSREGSFPVKWACATFAGTHLKRVPSDPNGDEGERKKNREIITTTGTNRLRLSPRPMPRRCRRVSL